MLLVQATAKGTKRTSSTPVFALPSVKVNDSWRKGVLKLDQGSVPSPRDGALSEISLIRIDL
jgi:hypothetical protein